MWRLTAEQGYKEMRFNVDDISDIQDIVELFDEFGEGDFEYNLCKIQEGREAKTDSE